MIIPHRYTEVLCDKCNATLTIPYVANVEAGRRYAREQGWLQFGQILLSAQEVKKGGDDNMKSDAGTNHKFLNNMGLCEGKMRHSQILLTHISPPSYNQFPSIHRMEGV